MLSVIVPTRNEAATISTLIGRIDAVLRGRTWELIVVDDSADATPGIVSSIANPRVRLIHRPPGMRTGGLGGAVVAGLAAASPSSDRFAVLDGDLQHDPAHLPHLFDALDHADLAIASRYAAGGGRGDGLAGISRRLASQGSRLAVHMVFPRLRSVSDPLSGYFAVRRSVVEGVAFRPQGFKVLLEILVREPREHVTELPFTLSPRPGGASKAGVREGIRFLRLVVSLRVGTKNTPPRSLETGSGSAAAPAGRPGAKGRVRSVGEGLHDLSTDGAPCMPPSAEYRRPDSDPAAARL